MTDGGVAVRYRALPDDFGFYLPGSGIHRNALSREESMSMKRKEDAPGTPRRTAKRAAPHTVALSVCDAPESGRERMIAEAAYFRAERRGFEPGQEVADWLQAEAEITRLAGHQT
jgi:hypothetical protein